jgi:hypothetical protein
MSEALDLYLRATAERRNARMLALADAHGLLISGTGGSLEALSSLAAISPLAPEAEVAALDELGPHQDLRAEPLDIQGTTFYLASLGGANELFADAPTAIARILT